MNDATKLVGNLTLMDETKLALNITTFDIPHDTFVTPEAFESALLGARVLRANNLDLFPKYIEALKTSQHWRQWREEEEGWCLTEDLDYMLNHQLPHVMASIAGGDANGAARSAFKLGMRFAAIYSKLHQPHGKS